MKALAQIVLPFKIEATDETLTANAGLVLFGEFIHGLGFKYEYYDFGRQF